MGFWEKLERSARARDSLLCVGLDPDPSRVPARYGGIAAFCRAIIEATADVACAYKPNIAFFEALGREGLDALADVLRAVPSDTPVILDAKRADIGSSSAAYARAVFRALRVDAVTVNPYLGRDGVAPFLDYVEHGVFVLCRTSNPSAGELQDWAQGGEPLYRRVAALAAEWAGDRPIGLVVGATWPEALADLREVAPSAWFLVPGVGTQGGEIDAVVRAGLRADGLGLVINASRSILYADDPGAAAADLCRAIRSARAHTEARPRSPIPNETRRLALALHDAGCVRFGRFTLHSGAASPVYIDLRLLVSHPQLLSEVARAYARLLRPLTYDRLAAIPHAGLPIGTAVALHLGRPLIYPRREAKAYGTRRAIEGEYQAGERIVLLDDLISSGGSKIEALEPLLAEGLVVDDLVVLIDRRQGGSEELARYGVRLHAALTLGDIVEALAEEGRLPADQAQRVRRYLAGQEWDG